MKRLLTVTAMALAYSAQANLIQNGSFETWHYIPGTPYREADGWTLSAGAGNYDVLRPPLYTSADGNNSLDMNGSGPSPSSIYQDVATTPGQTYYLSFAMSGNPDLPNYGTIKTMNIEFDGTLAGSEIFNVSGYDWDSVPWYWYQYQVVASGAVTRVRFASTVAWSSTGPLLDDVVLDTVARSLPVAGPQPLPQQDPVGVPDGGYSAGLLAVAMLAIVKRR